jgi:molybdate transport system substrate-binding protein
MKILFSIVTLCLMLQGSALFAADKAATKVTIVIAAAASLKNVFDQKLIPQFEKKYPNIKVEGTYDSSGKLQTQIEQGLAADVFFSAATRQMDNLVKGKFVNEGDVKKLLQNKLVLIKGKKTKTTVTGFEDITKAKDVIALGDPASVPAGQYAQEAFTKLGNWSAVQDAKPSLGTNVTEVLSWVAQGSAEVGVVYATDAASNKNITVITSLADGVLAAPVIYPVSVTAASAHKDEAQKLVEYLSSPEGIAVFKQFGFSENK